ncbi:MAG: hypothetical protein IPM69_03215 [Ignavibacteria bacterium]|nr:hypothetical protein [Ignavibacteria bacterium]
MKKAVLLFSLVLGLSSIGLHAQTAEEIIAKSIAATGGIEKIKALNSMKISGHAMVMGSEVPVKIFAKRPLMSRMEITIFGKTQLEVFDGTTAWQLNPFAISGVIEPTIVPEDQAKAIIDRADFDGDFVDYQAKGHVIEFMGKDEMEGSSVFKLKVTKKTGVEAVYFIDADNYLPIKIVTKTKTKDGIEEGDVILGNYKPVSGIQMAHSMDIRSGGITRFQVVIDKVEPNTPIENSIFVMPKK